MFIAQVKDQREKGEVFRIYVKLEAFILSPSLT